jgi:hypothetical protein
VSTVLELDVHAVPELVEVEAVPVDTDRVSDALCLLGRRSASLGHGLGLKRLVICCATRTIARGVTTIGASFPGVLPSELRFFISKSMMPRTCVFAYPRRHGAAAGSTNAQSATLRVHDVPAT